MKTRNTILTAAGCAVISCLRAHAATNLIDDTYGVGAGSFELGTYSKNSGSPYNYMELPAGSSTISGWTVGGSNGVDWVNSSSFATRDGNYALDLAGSIGAPSVGSISTVIPTIAGLEYTLSFSSYVAEPYSLTDASGLLTAGSLSQTFSPGLSADALNPDWVDYVWTFTALSSSTTITFATGPDATGFGPVIDNVVVSQVPEPSSLILGSLFVLLAGSRRKR